MRIAVVLLVLFQSAICSATEKEKWFVSCGTALMASQGLKLSAKSYRERAGKHAATADTLRSNAVKTTFVFFFPITTVDQEMLYQSGREQARANKLAHRARHIRQLSYVAIGASLFCAGAGFYVAPAPNGIVIAKKF